MKNFEKELENLAMYIQAYEDTSLDDGEALNELLKKITSTLFYLQNQQAIFKNKYDIMIYELTTDKKMTVARAVNFADVKIPENYLLRKVVEAGIRCQDSIRTHISYIKFEKRNA